MPIIFQISGGIGKSIASTAVVEAIKKNQPKQDIVVVTAYPEVFVNNPNVHKCLNFHNLQYFYRDYIEGKDAEIMVQEPYNTTEYVNGTMHLINAWANMYGVATPKNTLPRLYLNKREVTYYQSQLANIQKPIMILQTNGGAENQAWKYSWARDIPASVAQKVVNAYKDQYAIFHIRKADQIALQDTFSLDRASFREICALMMASKKRLLIDSFAQHAAAALDLPSTVLWIAHKPEILGYEMHQKIVANPFTTTPDLKFSFLSKFNLAGEPMEFPYNNEDEIFNADEIIEKLKD